MACADKQARLWDLSSNQVTVVGQHDSPVRSCHWITSPAYSCLMTSGWDKTVTIVELNIDDLSRFVSGICVSFQHRLPWPQSNCLSVYTAPMSCFHWLSLDCRIDMLKCTSWMATHKSSTTWSPS